MFSYTHRKTILYDKTRKWLEKTSQQQSIDAPQTTYKRVRQCWNKRKPRLRQP